MTVQSNGMFANEAKLIEKWNNNSETTQYLVRLSYNEPDHFEIDAAFNFSCETSEDLTLF